MNDVNITKQFTRAKMRIDQSNCTFCAGCSSVCPVQAISIRNSSSEISEYCIGCGNCKIFCPVSAIHLSSDQDTSV